MTAADLLVEAAEFLVGRRAIDHVERWRMAHGSSSKN